MRKILLLSFVLVGVSSCVSMKKYSALEERNERVNTQYEVAKNEMQHINAENKKLVEQNTQLKEANDKLEAEKATMTKELESVQKKLNDTRTEFDASVTDYDRQMQGKDMDLSTARGLLEERERQLNEKESRLEILQKEYDDRMEQLEDIDRKILEEEEKLKEVVENKNKVVDDLHRVLTQNLSGFDGQGLTVEVRDNRVVVAIENKLLFNSGSWQLLDEGMAVLKKVTAVLEANTNVEAMIFCYSDNVPFKGTSELKDNLDLNAMRSMYMMKTILENKKINMARLVASGRGRYTQRQEMPSNTNVEVSSSRTEVMLYFKGM